MEFTKDIYFDTNLTAKENSKITYSGMLYQNGANIVNIVFGFGSSWEYTTSLPMEKEDNGFTINVCMKDFDTFNFCFSDENNNWDNNNGFNYISPILPEIITPESINNKSNLVNNNLLDLDSLFNDLLLDLAVNNNDIFNCIPKMSIDSSLAEELDKVGEAVEKNSQSSSNNSKLISLFNELFEIKNYPVHVYDNEENNFNLDSLVSDLLEPVVNKVAENIETDASLLDDISPETSLTVVGTDEFAVSPRKLSTFYKIKKRIRLAFLELSKLSKKFVKQLGF